MACLLLDAVPTCNISWITPFCLSRMSLLFFFLDQFKAGDKYYDLLLLNISMWIPNNKDILV